MSSWTRSFPPKNFLPFLAQLGKKSVHLDINQVQLALYAYAMDILSPFLVLVDDFCLARTIAGVTTSRLFIWAKIPVLPNCRLPHPSECQLYYVNRDTLFSYHKASEVFLQVFTAPKPGYFFSYSSLFMQVQLLQNLVILLARFAHIGCNLLLKKLLQSFYLLGYSLMPCIIGESLRPLHIRGLALESDFLVAYWPNSYRNLWILGTSKESWFLSEGGLCLAWNREWWHCMWHLTIRIRLMICNLCLMLQLITFLFCLVSLPTLTSGILCKLDQILSSLCFLKLN